MDALSVVRLMMKLNFFLETVLCYRTVQIHCARSSRSPCPCPFFDKDLALSFQLLLYMMEVILSKFSLSPTVLSTQEDGKLGTGILSTEDCASQRTHVLRFYSGSFQSTCEAGFNTIA